MGFWDDDEDEDAKTSPVEVSVSATEALQLVSKILHIPAPQGQQAKQINQRVQQLNRMIDQQVLDTVRNLHLPDELGKSYRLQRLSDRVEEYQKNQLLRGRAIIGIGGSFSAGKSAFINSLFQTQIKLPEKATPSTAIPTYFMNGKDSQIWAYTRNNQPIPLTEKEMKAFTHQFDQNYHIGFAAFLKNLFIVNQKEGFQQLAFLDTPGYSKPGDARKGKQEITDYEIAKSQLRTVDYLIWLVDANSTLTESDLDFIESLRNPCPVLLIFTKADKKKRSEKELQDQFFFAKKTLKNRQIRLYGVTCYSSAENKEYIGKDVLAGFLRMAEKEAAQKKDVIDEMNDILQEVDQYLEERISQLRKQRTDLKEHVTQAIDFSSISSLVGLIDSLDLEIDELVQSQRQLRDVGRGILTAIDRLNESSF